MKGAPQAVLFDLDGTLTDPKLGITRSIQHALRKRGLPVPDADALAPCIGPPLEQSFRERFGSRPTTRGARSPTTASTSSRTGCTRTRCIRAFPSCSRGSARRACGSRWRPRSRPSMRSASSSTSSSPRTSSTWSAASLDGRRTDKVELVADALALLDGVPRERAVLVGDRMHDLAGARANGIAAIAVGYGYGGRKERWWARAPSRLAESVAALGRLLGSQLSRAPSRAPSAGPRATFLTSSGAGVDRPRQALRQLLLRRREPVPVPRRTPCTSGSAPGGTSARAASRSSRGSRRASRAGSRRRRRRSARAPPRPCTCPGPAPSVRPEPRSGSG